MNDIRLHTLTIEHFKGVDHLALAFGGGDADIYGDNATGKTTVYDALTWLLFGKNSAGAGTFEIKPLDREGNVKDHEAITAVEADMEWDEGRVTLRRTYGEKWSVKRGQGEATFDGNTSDYAIDGVPCKKFEFDRHVAAMVDEDLFKALTNVHHFCGNMDWKERRRVLFDVCGVASDAEIMASDLRFTPLAEDMGRLSLEDYRKKMLAKKKGLVGVRNDVPVRLDECQKVINTLKGTDFAALRMERDGRVEYRNSLSEELLKLENSSLVNSKKNQLEKIRLDMIGLNQENQAYRQSQMAQWNDGDPAAIEREIASAKRLLLRFTSAADTEKASMERYEKGIVDGRAQWQRTNGEGFPGASCPSCGQALVGQALVDATEAFHRGKQSKLDLIVSQANVMKDEYARASERRELDINNAVNAENRIAELTDKLEACRKVKKPVVVDMADFQVKLAALHSSDLGLSKEISALENETGAIRGEIQRKITDLSQEITAIDGEVSREAILDFNTTRMDELRADAKATAEQLEWLEKFLFLCEEFTRYKTSFVENRINDHFLTVKWKLFAEQVNGGVSECCEATVDGVPYGSLNNGCKINVGMDVISALSQHYGVQVPLFVDNGESVTNLLSVPNQVIRLVVSETDKELRVHGT